MTALSEREGRPVAGLSSDARDPVELLADEFLGQLRRGGRPTIEEYAARHPDLADAIRDLFPTLLMMVNLGEGPPDATGSCSPGGAAVGTGLPPTRLGDYRILREIGRGGMGIVYEAEQGSLGRRVALKVLSTQAQASPQQARRFEREARAAGRLHHTNIVPVFGVGREGDTPYYVMQYIPGPPLSEVLVDLRRLRDRTAPVKGRAVNGTSAADVAHSLWSGAMSGAAEPGVSDGSRGNEEDGEGKDELAPPVPADAGTSIGLSDSNLLIESSLPSRAGRPYVRTVARLGIQAAEALDYAAGQGVLHRDVKPSNLLLDVRGTLWVTDFGLAKLAGQDDLTQTGDILGTLRYMAPERFQGRTDIRSDVYGLGLTLYELLALRPAFDESDRSRLIHLVSQSEPTHLLKLDPAIPRDLATVVHKAIAREPSDRYPTAGALAEDLRRFLEDRPIAARRLGPLGVCWRWCRRNSAVAALLGLVIVLLASGLTGSLMALRYFKNLADSEGLAKGEAVRSYGEAQAVTDFFINDMLSMASPNQAPGKDVTVNEVLQRADRAIEGKFADQPLVEASIRLMMGRTYHSQGQDTEAVRHLSRALDLQRKFLGPKHQDTVPTLVELAFALIDQGKKREAAPLIESSMEISRRVHGQEHEITLRAASELAWVWFRTGRKEEAQVLLRQTVETMRRVLGLKHPLTLKTTTRLGSNLRDLGELNEARALLESTLEHQQRIQSPNHPFTLETILHLATTYRNLGDLERARSLLEGVLPAVRQVFQPGHRNRHNAAAYLAALLVELDEPEQALKVVEPELEAIPPDLDPVDGVRMMMRSSASALQKCGQLRAAQERYEELLEMIRRMRGPGTVEAQSVRAPLVSILLARGDSEAAQSRAEEILDGPPRADAKCLLAIVLWERGEKLRARTLFDEVLGTLERERGPADPITLFVAAQYAIGVVAHPDPDDSDLARALALSQRVVEAKPGDSRYQADRGIVLYRAGDCPGAVAALETSDRLARGCFKGDARGGFFLAMARWKLGERDRAGVDLEHSVAWMARYGSEDVRLRDIRAEAEALILSDSSLPDDPFPR